MIDGSAIEEGDAILAIVSNVEQIMKHINQFYDCYEIGRVEMGKGKVKFENRINWL